MKQFIWVFGLVFLGFPHQGMALDCYVELSRESNSQLLDIQYRFEFDNGDAIKSQDELVYSAFSEAKPLSQAVLEHGRVRVWTEHQPDDPTHPKVGIQFVSYKDPRNNFRLFPIDPDTFSKGHHQVVLGRILEELPSDLNQLFLRWDQLQVERDMLSEPFHEAYQFAGDTKQFDLADGPMAAEALNLERFRFRKIGQKTFLEKTGFADRRINRLLEEISPDSTRFFEVSGQRSGAMDKVNGCTLEVLKNNTVYTYHFLYATTDFSPPRSEDQWQR